jgi:tetratricopeptide (TPR) repeat protein
MVESTTRIDVTLGRLMRRGGSWLGAVIIVAAVVALGPRARAIAGPVSKDAQSLAGEATAAFRMGRYAEAAGKYDEAFALRPDPALLYNAAQSYRLAGNQARALEHYRNYVGLYPDCASAEDARGHVSRLTKVVEDRRSPPAIAPAPVPAIASPPTSQDSAGVPLLARPAPAPDDAKRSLTQETWFWVALGAAAAVVATTVVLLASRDETFPEPTFGTARGN